jgi:predicted lipid carrier protein YhbT
LSSNLFAARAASVELKPIPEALKAKALAQVDQALVRQGLLDKSGRVSEKVVAELSFERTSSIPTPGLMVKGCLDDCDTCEPALERAIELELEHKQLQNELLKKQIELLDKSREYRCCGDEASAEADAAAM